MVPKEGVQRLTDLTQSLELNSPDLDPNYAVLEEIYSSWLDKHGVLQINRLH